MGGEYDEDDAEFYETNENVGNTSLYSFSFEQGDNYAKRITNDTSLKVGVIIKTHEIDDKSSISKTLPEYDVLIIQEGEAAIEPVIYKNCINTEMFGGKGDFFEYRLRENTKQPKGKNNENTNMKERDGSVVIILCMDGKVEKGVILKSVYHKARGGTTLTKDAGLHMEGEYNGVNWQVNKDGEFTVTFKSKTDNDGKPQDENSGGTHLKMDKKGSVDINTNLEGGNETYIRMDKENKDVGLKAGANVGFTAKKDVTMNADGNIAGKAKTSIAFEAEGTAKVAAKSELTLEGKSVVNIKGDNLDVNCKKIFTFASETFLGGKVYVGDGGAPAVIATTQFVGQGNHGAPVKCSAIGPFSKNVFIAP